MSVEFYSNSGEAGGDRLNLVIVDEDLKIRPNHQSGSEMFAQRCKSWTRVAAVCLGLLCLVLLAGIIGLVAHYTNVTGLHDAEMQDIKTKYENMTSQQNQLQSSYDTLTKKRDQLKASYNSLSTERDNLANERDQLKNSTSNLTKERDQLKNSTSNLTKERDQLKNSTSNLTKERDQLKNSTSNLTKERDQLRNSTSNLTKERDQLKNSTSNLTKERDQLKNSTSNLTKERDQLKIITSNLTKERDQFKIRYDTVAESRDELQEEVNRLNLNITEKACRHAWTRFRGSCYYISTSSRSWQGARQDCQDRGADLVIINSKEEQTFIAKFYERTWIGLSDKQVEGEWKWVDGTDLVGDGFWQEGEPNDAKKKENCVEVSRGSNGWNDLRCSETLSWACEMRFNGQQL
ncbi:uncharacterized protein ACJ7VT_015130 [Polymixia lowei]